MLKRISKVFISLLLFVCILFVSSILELKSEVYGITDNLVRFHIIGNSDSDFDQKTKMKIREEIFEKYDFSGIDSKEATLKYFKTNKNSMENFINEKLDLMNANYKCKIKIQKESFPIRQYDNFTLPSGIYDSVIIELGVAKGKNFFCVMYPSICMVDSVSEQTKGEFTLLNGVLSENEIRTVTDTKDKTVIKFKIIETLDKLLAR